MERYMRGFDSAHNSRSPATTHHNSEHIPVGRWKKGPGRFKKQAHICCLVLVHIRVDQRRFASSVNNDTTTLRATRAKSSSIGAMERYMRGFDLAHNSRCPATTHHNSEHTSGAMEEMSERVQNASTHALRRRIHEHAHSSRSVQRSVQGGNGTLRAGSICMETHVLPQTHVCSGQ